MNTTLIVDGNWLLMSRLFALKPAFDISKDQEEKERAKEQLEELLCKSINLVLNRFSDVIDNIILVSDGGSWRKSLEKPKDFDIVYKGNRIKDSETDWQYVYKALEEIISKAESLGITVSKAGSIEGDDWAFYWSRFLNSKGINCVIWSSDADLKQLVQVSNGAFTAWLNESQKGGLPGLFLSKELDDSGVDELDMFMQIDNSSPSVDALCAKVSAVNYINPDDIAIDKIMCGDKGDNIKSPVQIMHNSRTYKLTEKDWHTIKNSLEIENMKDFLNKRQQVCKSIMQVPKYAKYKLNGTFIKEMIDYNISLVWLNESVIPEDIKSKMSESEYHKYDLSYIRSNYKMLMPADPGEKTVDELFNDIFS